MSRPRSIYVVSMFNVIFSHFHLHNLMSRHTCSFAYFLEYVPLFLDDNVYEECVA